VATDEEVRVGVARAIEPYRHLLERFVRGELSADDFESQYMDNYLSDQSLFADNVFAIVDAFFAEAESYEGDAYLRAQVHRAIGPDDLRREAAELLRVAGYEVQRSGF
jgi:hypothetical protein